MSTEELFLELRKLNHADKLRAMHLLVLELSAEQEALLIPGAQYDVWSPFDAASASEKLAKMLQEDKESRNGR
jgi:hypothetical protein